MQPTAILASNTSSLRIASIASACEHRTRVGGLHFFNPVPLMKLVEVVRAPDTANDIVDALCTIGERMGRTPVIVRDRPGFLVNFGGRAYYTEGLRIAHEQIASPAQVDAVMRDSCGFRMGLFELMDLTGIDVNFPASSIIYNGYFQDRRIATSPLHESLFASGRLGRKTRSGYYTYDEEGKKIGADANTVSSAEPIGSVSLAEPDQPLAAFLSGIELEIMQVDDGRSPILAAPLWEDCTAVAARTGADHRRLVAIDLSAIQPVSLRNGYAPWSPISAAKLLRSASHHRKISIRRCDWVLTIPKDRSNWPTLWAPTTCLRSYRICKPLPVMIATDRASGCGAGRCWAYRQ